MNDKLTSAIFRHKEEICEKLLRRRNFNTINGLNSTGSDPHNGNLKTTRVITDAGVFVYKPHDLRQDEFLCNFVRKFAEGCFYVPECIACSRTDADGNTEYYGFCEYIECVPPSCCEEAADYYCNLGALSAFTHMLGSTDMHFENILSVKSIPVPVDLETFFGACSYNPEADDHPDMVSSVIVNGMYPTRLRGSVEISPLISLATENMGAPVIDGKRRSIYGYEEHFYDGFKKMYMKLMSEREEIIGVLRDAPDFRIRILPRMSDFYAKLLQKLSEGADDDYLRQRLSDCPYGLTGISAETMISREIESLSAGDIPYFFLHSNSRNLFDVKGIVAEDVFVSSPINEAIFRLENFSTAELSFELELQRHVISRACVPASADFSKPSQLPSCTEAEGILGTIMDDRLNLPGGEKRWFVNLGNIRRMPISLSWYNGLIGMTAVFNAFALLYPDSKYTDEINKITEETFDLLEKYILACEHAGQIAYPEFNPGRKNGWAGLIEGLLYIMHYTGQCRCLDLASRLTNLIEKIELCNISDMTRQSGIAGVLEIICKLKDFANGDNAVVSDELIRKYAYTLLDRRIKAADGLWYPLGRKRYISGFDAGMGGIGYALMLAGKQLNDKTLLQAADDAFAYEQSVFTNHKRGWQDMSLSTASPELFGGYHSGNAGMGFLWMMTGDDEMYAKAIRSIIECPLEEMTFSDRLDDGRLGVCDFLIEASLRKGGDEELLSLANKIFDDICQREKHYSGRRFHQVYEVPLFTGDTGRLYIKLRLEAPDRIKCLLI